MFNCHCEERRKNGTYSEKVVGPCACPGKQGTAENQFKMTHKELLAKLKPTNTPFPIYSPNAVVNALRAVVELHKPGFAGDLDEYSCQECSDFEDFNYRIYPCSTIQAIEKELK